MVTIPSKSKIRERDAFISCSQPIMHAVHSSKPLIYMENPRDVVNEVLIARHGGLQTYSFRIYTIESRKLRFLFS